MSTKKLFVLLLLRLGFFGSLFFLSFPIQAQNSQQATQTLSGQVKKLEASQSAHDRRLSSLEAERKIQEDAIKFYRDEGIQFRTFIQQERESHQSFLEWMYRILGMVLLLVSALAGFFLNRNFQQLKKNLEDRIALSYEEKLGELISSKISQSEAKINTLHRMLDREHNWSQARILYVHHSSEDVPNRMLERFKQKSANVTAHQLEDLAEIPFSQTDILIYPFQPQGENGQDPILEKLLKEIQKSSTKLEDQIPLVLYVARGLRVGGKNYQDLETYGLFSMANSEISLINQSLDAYRYNL